MSLATANANTALDSALVDALRVQLHVGAPGAAGTSNQFGDTTRQVVSWSAAASGEKAASNTPTWSPVSAAGTVTHVSLWTTGGVYRGSAQLLKTRALEIGDSLVLASLKFTSTHD